MSTLAIVTKYHGYTNRLSSQIKATGRVRKEYSDGAVSPELSTTINYDQGLSSDRNHGNAAQCFARKHGWNGLFVCGGLPSMDGFVYVRLDGSFSHAWAAKYLCGVEGVDWFLVREQGE